MKKKSFELGLHIISYLYTIRGRVENFPPIFIIFKIRRAFCGTVRFITNEFQLDHKIQYNLYNFLTRKNKENLK